MKITQQPSPKIFWLASCGSSHQPDLLRAKGLANKTQAPLPPDLAVAAHPPHRPMSRVDPGRWHLPIYLVGTPIQTLRHRLAQALVRPLPVKLLHPAITTLLLLCP